MSRNLTSILALTTALGASSFVQAAADMEYSRESNRIRSQKELPNTLEETRWNAFQKSGKPIVEYVASISESDPEAAGWFLVSGGKSGFRSTPATAEERQSLMTALRNVAKALKRFHTKSEEILTQYAQFGAQNETSNLHLAMLCRTLEDLQSDTRILHENVQELKDQLASERKDRVRAIETLKKEKDKEIAALRQEKDKEIAALRQEKDREIGGLVARLEQETRERKEVEKRLEYLRVTSEQKLEDLRQTLEEKTADFLGRADKNLEKFMENLREVMASNERSKHQDRIDHSAQIAQVLSHVDDLRSNVSDLRSLVEANERRANEREEQSRLTLLKERMERAVENEESKRKDVNTDEEKERESLKKEFKRFFKDADRKKREAELSDSAEREKRLLSQMETEKANAGKILSHKDTENQSLAVRLAAAERAAQEAAENARREVEALRSQLDLSKSSQTGSTAATVPAAVQTAIVSGVDEATSPLQTPRTPVTRVPAAADFSLTEDDADSLIKK